MAGILTSILHLFAGDFLLHIQDSISLKYLRPIPELAWPYYLMFVRKLDTLSGGEPQFTQKDDINMYVCVCVSNIRNYGWKVQSHGVNAICRSLVMLYVDIKIWLLFLFFIPSSPLFVYAHSMLEKKDEEKMTISPEGKHDTWLHVQRSFTAALLVVIFVSCIVIFRFVCWIICTGSLVCVSGWFHRFRSLSASTIYVQFLHSVSVFIFHSQFGMSSLRCIRCWVILQKLEKGYPYIDSVRHCRAYLPEKKWHFSCVYMVCIFVLVCCLLRSRVWSEDLLWLVKNKN